MKTGIVVTFALFVLFSTVASGWAAAFPSQPTSDLPPLPLPVWRSEVAAPGVALTDQGLPGMALDPAGRPHVVYGENRLFHAWHDGAAWQVETVDVAGAVSGPVIAIDETGVITIVAYPRRDTVTITHLTAYRRAPGGTWQTAPVPMPALFTVPPEVSLALDSAGRPHLIAAAPAFWDTRAFVYAYASPSGWVSETVATNHDADGQPALALDSHDRPVVLYGSIETLWLARAGAAGWQHEQLAASVASIIAGRSLALDSQDRAHAVFSDHNTTRLTYVRQTAAGWQTTELPNDGTSPSLAIDAVDRPHLVYLSSPEGMVYAVEGPDGWTETPVPVGEFGGSYNTLLLDNARAAHVVSLSFAHSLLYATNQGGSWATRLLAVEEVVGEPHALALDASDKPYLLYYQPSTGALRWAARDGDEWATSLVAEVGHEGLEVALDVGPNGVAQMAYIDGGQLIAGSRGAGGWALQTLTTDVHNLGLAVGENNRLHLVVIQNDRLIYWTKQGGVWQSEPASPAGVGVQSAFMALDSQGRPKVVYTATGVDGLTVAVRQGAGDWVAGSMPYRRLIAMALGPDDTLHLLHITERVEGVKPPQVFVALNLAEQQGDDWQDSQLSEGPYIGEQPDGRLLFDDEGRRHIVVRGSYGWLDYYRQDANGQTSDGGIPGQGGAFDLAVGSDGQPRVSRQLHGDVVLYRRDTLWLVHHSLLPVVPGR